MYNPKYATIENEDLVLKLIKDFPLGLMISKDQEKIEANYYPFYAEKTQAQIYLWMHLAKSNPHWKSFGDKVVINFQGPNRYISPTIYVKPMNVPTWNYAVVQMRGTVELIQDQKGINTILHQSVAVFEKQNGTDWQYNLPPKMQEGLQAAIVGVKITVQSIQAKFKLNQNRESEDYEAVSTFLKNSKNQNDQQMYEWMQISK